MELSLEEKEQDVFRKKLKIGELLKQKNLAILITTRLE